MHSNSRYFDFEMDLDRVTGLSVFLLEKLDNQDCLNPKKRHADYKIRILLVFKSRNGYLTAHEKSNTPETYVSDLKQTEKICF